MLPNRSVKDQNGAGGWSVEQWSQKSERGRIRIRINVKRGTQIQIRIRITYLDVKILTALSLRIPYRGFGRDPASAPENDGISSGI